mgnify:FL=1
MEKDEFFYKLQNQAQKIDINLTNKQLNEFYTYMNLLIEWNKNINLTAITEPEEIIKKHFIDSLTISKNIQKDSSIIDVGTGAGFPGIPLKIVREDINVVLLDALNKRLNFLNEVVKENKLENIETVHFRAEEIGKNKKYREKYDIATSRAVAQLNILAEYLLPLVKIGGKCICMKGSNVEEELKNSKKAITLLGGEIEKIEEFILPDSDIKRNVIIIKKVNSTPAKYPRKPGTPAKEPII